jgi:toluene monooxygenase system ferredoxin subunit
MTWSKAEGMEDLWDGEMRSCRVDGRRVLVLKLEGAVRAYEDRCAHLAVPMSEGRFEGGVLTCRAHEYQYDAATGEGINPRTVRLKAFPARLEKGEIWVDVTSE